MINSRNFFVTSMIIILLFLTAGCNDSSSKNGKDEKSNSETSDEKVPVEGIYIDNKEKEMYVNQTLQLNIVILPTDAADQKFVWSSANNNVATVSDKGLVSALHPGKVLIVIESESGYKKSLCYITVKGKPVLRKNHKNSSGSIENYYTYEYDMNLNQKKFCTYDASGILQEYEIKEYDANNNATKWSYYKGNVNLQGYCIYEYSGDSKLYKEKYFNASNLLEDYLIYEYDKGMLKKTCSYNEAEIMESYTIYDYNSDGNLVKKSGYNEGSMQKYETYEYDALGNEIKWAVFNSVGILQRYRTYEYDLNYNLIKMSDFNGAGTLVEYRVPEYDEFGNVKKMNHYNGSSLIEYFIVSYDLDGLEICETVYNASNKLQYSLEYLYK